MKENKPLVFVVDDEPIIARTLAVLLGRFGFSALAFTQPQEALAASREASPDLLISDVTMPEMTGLELALAFRTSYPECKALLFSGHAATSDLLAEARADGHSFQLLSEPVYPGDLLARLRSAHAAAYSFVNS